VIDETHMLPATLLAKLEGEEWAELAALSTEAGNFLMAHKWCAGIKAMSYDRGFSKLAVFYAEIEPRFGADANLWLVVGDVPPAYLSAVDHASGIEALEGYVCEIDRWTKAAQAGESVEELMPIRRRGSLAPVEPSREMADLLSRRLRLIERILSKPDRDPDETGQPRSDCDGPW
jgi:hypothetical protein